MSVELTFETLLEQWICEAIDSGAVTPQAVTAAVSERYRQLDQKTRKSINEKFELAIFETDHLTRN